jgi:hypothetical protein
MELIENYISNCKKPHFLNAALKNSISNSPLQTKRMKIFRQIPQMLAWDHNRALGLRHWRLMMMLLLLMMIMIKCSYLHTCTFRVWEGHVQIWNISFCLCIRKVITEWLWKKYENDRYLLFHTTVWWMVLYFTVSDVWGITQAACS